MYFETTGIYHIYNQGNNRQAIFFNRENYLFFTHKIRQHILPYADILAWCLMPNHFHLMVEVKDAGIDRVADTRDADCDADSRGEADTDSRGEAYSRGATLSRTPTSTSTPTGTPTGTPEPDLNHSIGIMLASYTRAINKQENISGSLFRQKTKAICLNEIKSISSNWFTSFGVTFMKVDIPALQYPQVCFNYIHANPVNAGIVKRAEDWEFSSYADLAGLRNGSLVNRDRVTALGLVL